MDTTQETIFRKFDVTKKVCDCAAIAVCRKFGFRVTRHICRLMGAFSFNNLALSFGDCKIFARTSFALSLHM